MANPDRGEERHEFGKQHPRGHSGGFKPVGVGDWAALRLVGGFGAGGFWVSLEVTALLMTASFTSIYG